MSSKLKDIRLIFEKNKKPDRFVFDKKIFLEKINNILRTDSTIVTIEIDDIVLLKKMHDHLNKKCEIIIYLKDEKSALKTRNALDKKNIIVINNSFEKNDIKSNIVDYLIGSNVMGKNGKNSGIEKEINRVLKTKGSFTFFESVNTEKNGIAKNCIKKQKENPFYYYICTFINKLHHIKNSEYELEIYNANDKKNPGIKINNLKELSNFLKNDNRYEELSSADLTLTFNGKKNS